MTDLFTDTPPAAISQAERDYNAAFASRLPDILRRREIGMVPVTYEGILTTHTGERWTVSRVTSVVWVDQKTREQEARAA